jgi:hypothetical protein
MGMDEGAQKADYTQEKTDTNETKQVLLFFNFI